MEFEKYESLTDALRKGINMRPEIKTERVDILEAVGRYSATEIKSPADFPRYDRSAMDGYALKSSETISASKTNPALFQVIGELFPSSRDEYRVGKGEAVKIMTGGKIPEGSDSVVMMEETALDGGTLQVYSPVRKYQNISRRGEDLKEGFVIVHYGDRIVPPDIVALLEVGVRQVEVISFKIGVLSTGDELVTGEVVNTTQPFLKEFFEWNGIQTAIHGAVRDDRNAIKEKLMEMDEDILVVTGGTGPGELDLLHDIVGINGEIIFHGLRIRPGRTTGLGLFNGKPLFMISGLPVASLIASENVILELISSWYGIERKKTIIMQGKLTRSVVNTLGFRSFVRVKIEEKRGEVLVTPLRTTGSGVIYSVIGADGILVLDENSEGISEGSTVQVQLIRW